MCRVSIIRAPEPEPEYPANDLSRCITRNPTLWCKIRTLQDLDVSFHQTRLLQAIVDAINAVSAFGPDRLFHDAAIVESVNKVRMIDGSTVRITDRPALLYCRNATTLLLAQYPDTEDQVLQLRQLHLESDPFVALDMLREALFFILTTLLTSVN